MFDHVMQNIDIRIQYYVNWLGRNLILKCGLTRMYKSSPAYLH
jgi:hypothetical protein